MTTSAPRNDVGVASLVLAVIGFGFGWVPATMPLAIAFGMLAVGFGVFGCVRLNRGVASNFAVTVVGLALGTGVAVLAVWAVLI